MSDTTSSERLPATPAPSAVEPQPVRSAHQLRFRLVYVLLAVLAGAGVGAFVVALTRDASPSGTAEAAGRPNDPVQSGELGAAEIAEQVQRNYRLPNGDELVDVIATRNTLQDGNLGLLRVRYQVFRPVDEQEGKDSTLVVPDDAIQYSLCGAGSACGIPGTATPARGLLLRRMGLELALRTMQFDSGVDNVMVFLRPIPPPNGSDGLMLVYRRNLLSRLDPGLLETPIGQTLPGAGSVMKPGSMAPAVGRRVEQLTRPYLYSGRYQLLGGRDVLLQLEPYGNG